MRAAAMAGCCVLATALLVGGIFFTVRAGLLALDGDLFGALTAFLAAQGCFLTDRRFMAWADVHYPELSS